MSGILRVGGGRSCILNRVVVVPAPPGSTYPVPNTRFGSEPLVWDGTEDDTPDDDEDRPTDPDVVKMLGFGPMDLDWDDSGKTTDTPETHRQQMQKGRPLARPPL